jgi:cytochrome c
MLMMKFLLNSCCALTMLFAAACAVDHRPAPAAPPATPAPDALVAQGQARWVAYKCYECHGAHGEGTDDAPDLTGTRLDADAIALFLQKPSAHARSIGMPSIPSDSPDLRPLVAFVLSLKRGPASP